MTSQACPPSGGARPLPLSELEKTSWCSGGGKLTVWGSVHLQSALMLLRCAHPQEEGQSTLGILVVMICKLAANTELAHTSCCSGGK